MTETDAVVIGAGPVGLFQVFQLGLLEIKAHVVDSLPYAGGQCMELYPDKPIYDIPGLPMCTGQELAERLLRQVAPFEPVFHYRQVVTSLARQPDGCFLLETSNGTRLLTRTVFIAAGVGAFQPRTLKVEGIERFQGTQLFHDVGDPATFADKNLVIVGGDDAAVEWALNFCAAHADRHPHKARRVTLLHRRDVFRSSDESLTQLRQSFEQRAIDLVVGQITGFTEAEGKLVALKVTDPDNVTRDLALDMLLVLLGVSPKLGPVADWGLDLERKQLQVDTEKFSTNVPGIFAVGDINTYPGKKKLIVCGFHECVLAAFGAAPLIFPDKKILLQYTTTSPRLHALLGVAKTASD